MTSLPCIARPVVQFSSSLSVFLFLFIYFYLSRRLNGEEMSAEIAALMNINENKREVDHLQFARKRINVVMTIMIITPPAKITTRRKHGENFNLVPELS